jgi:hypothetical protein
MSQAINKITLGLSVAEKIVADKTLQYFIARHSYSSPTNFVESNSKHEEK